MTQPQYIGWDVPSEIDTIYGVLPAGELTFKTGVEDDEDETRYWIEAFKDGELVHRSAMTALKKWPAGCEAAAAAFN